MRPAPGHAAALLVLLGGCAKDAPQDYLQPEGPIAREAHEMFSHIVFFSVIPVLVVVLGLLIFAIVRNRDPGGRADPLEIPGKHPKLRWVVAPTVVLLAIDLFPLASEAKVIFELAKEPEDALQVEVYGHMWWWEYVYPGEKISTANELHIPTGRPVRLTLRTIEPGLPAPEGEEFATGVIHSFWVPKLAGKQDVVPGRDNKMTIEAEKPGTYKGQCAEYCNLSHANMRLRVIAQEPADFEAWVAEQQRPAVKPASGPAAEGYEIFNGEGGCVACHTVIGIDGALARTGPNLTHLKSRETFAGSIFENTKANLIKWVTDPPAMKPMRPDEGTGMPDRDLSDEDVEKVVAYLETLK